MTDTTHHYAIIGAGPAGLAVARNLDKLGIPFIGFEAGSTVGGLWNIDNPRSTMYRSAHLISSKRMTEFKEFPMDDRVADYPHHTEVYRYFKAFAERFDLNARYEFDTDVTAVAPIDGSPDKGWRVTTRSRKNGSSTDRTRPFKGVVIANGTLSEPNQPRFRGTFSGRLMHAAEYKHPDVFEDRRVLIVGAGNSGCDIVVDAVHRARFVGLSVRRGYHFVPKYVFGRPADTVGGRIKLPFALKQRLDKVLLKCFTGDPQRFGFPKPDHDLYESHPIVNSLVLHHIGHGDITLFKDIARLDGDEVVFRDGTRQAFDLILTATGYKLHYPFIDKRYLNWQGAAPHFYLNAFHPEYDNLFIAGLVEAAGLGWEGRNEQAELIARFIQGIERNQAAAIAFQNLKRAPFPDMRGGVNYLKLDRMAYYVHKDTYRATVGRHLREFQDGGSS
ncbi:MAG: NAD(P)/FAD-dependent oxidoreductase [Deltaproteobacteria bacterium]|nr:NAD(P)/FAD-dependent oxidoreductase [Deltaproteobacteria bacterium]